MVPKKCTSMSKKCIHKNFWKRKGGHVKGSFGPMSRLVPETQPSGPLVLAGGLVGEGFLNLPSGPLVL